MFQKKNIEHDSCKRKEEHDILHEILLMSKSTRSLLKLDIITQNYLYEYVDKYYHCVAA